MNTIKIAFIIGTRPQIVKSAPFIYLADNDDEISLDIIHTGQHYDYEMTKVFFEELNLPEPKVNLGVGSGSHSQQTARIMIRLERVLRKRDTDLVIIPGDTNSTLAGALTAAKLNINIAHIEAGARSFDIKMPEEINRRLTDHCSTILFTPTENCTKNLLREGIDRSRIYQVGDTMYDVFIQQLPKADKSDILNILNLDAMTYAVATVHREENVDNVERLKNIVRALTSISELKIVFPIHPRTMRQLKRTGLYKLIKKHPHMILIKPVGYHEMIKLMKNANFILTDSGGMQKEAFWLRIPCITLRENTEWVETVELGANILTGADTLKIIREMRRFLKGEVGISDKIRDLPNPFGEGDASKKIIEIIKSLQDQSI